MVNRFISWILSLIGIAIFVVIVGGIVFGVLAATGGGLDGCTPDKPDATGIIVKRGVTRSSELSQEWQRIWDDFDARLAAGQSGSISFTEGQASSRADAFLKDKDAPVDNVVICFHEGEGEAGA